MCFYYNPLSSTPHKSSLYLFNNKTQRIAPQRIIYILHCTITVPPYSRSRNFILYSTFSMLYRVYISLLIILYPPTHSAVLLFVYLFFCLPPSLSPSLCLSYSFTKRFVVFHSLTFRQPYPIMSGRPSDLNKTHYSRSAVLILSGYVVFPIYLTSVCIFSSCGCPGCPADGNRT